MSLHLFESPRPEADTGIAEEVAREIFGVVGTATALGGERDANFRIESTEGAFALKIANAADNPDSVAVQVLAMEHARAVDPSIPIPSVRRTVAGQPIGSFVIGAQTHCTQLVGFLGGYHPEAPSSPAFRRSLGTTLARLSRALRGFDHPGVHRPLIWDVTSLADLAPKLEFVEREAHPLLARHLDRFIEDVAPRLPLLPAQAIHGDSHSANLLVGADDPDRVSGLVDFGDMSHGPRVLELAVSAAYQTFGSDPVTAIAQMVAAYHAHDPLEAMEVGLIPDLAIARLVQSYLISAWRVTVDPDNAEYILSDQTDVLAALRSLDGVDLDAAGNVLRRACGWPTPLHRSRAEALSARKRLLGPALALSYDTEVRLVAAEGVWLTDIDGHRLLDAYNNVPHVGHNHPQVTNALTRQARTLTTNTRYLVNGVLDYAERLAGLLPGELSVVMFVNSGSEANDLAYQIARTVTGHQGVVTTEHAYHGTTWATASMSPEELDPAKLEAWSVRIGGAATLAAADAAGRVAAETDVALAELGRRGESPAMFIADSVFSSDGIFSVPTGYLAAVYSTVRAAGGLCVADEVQAGFGRVGTRFWGFSADEVTPDIVTLGKPMGNGHPMGAVITTPAIAEAFAASWHFFSTFAGSPVAAAAGMAVLDVLEDEGLPARADEVGAYLRAQIASLSSHSIVDVRGPGLFIGVELTDSEAAGQVVNTMRDLGVLVGRTGRRGNVIKIRPPLVFSERNVDQVVAALAQALAT